MTHHVKQKGLCRDRSHKSRYFQLFLRVRRKDLRQFVSHRINNRRLKFGLNKPRRIGWRLLRLRHPLSPAPDRRGAREAECFALRKSIDIHARVDVLKERLAGSALIAHEHVVPGVMGCVLVIAQPALLDGFAKGLAGVAYGLQARDGLGIEPNFFRRGVSSVVIGSHFVLLLFLVDLYKRASYK
jgi:hypothetical protein